MSKKVKALIVLGIFIIITFLVMRFVASPFKVAGKIEGFSNGQIVWAMDTKVFPVEIQKGDFLIIKKDSPFTPNLVKVVNVPGEVAIDVYFLEDEHFDSIKDKHLVGNHEYVVTSGRNNVLTPKENIIKKVIYP